MPPAESQLLADAQLALETLTDAFRTQVERDLLYHEMATLFAFDECVTHFKFQRAILEHDVAIGKVWSQAGQERDIRPPRISELSRCRVALDTLDASSLNGEVLRALAAGCKTLRAALRTEVPPEAPLPQYRSALEEVMQSIQQQALPIREIQLLAGSMIVGMRNLAQYVTPEAPLGQTIDTEGNPCETGTMIATGLRTTVPLLEQHFGMRIAGADRLPGIVEAIRAYKVSLAEREIAGFAQQLATTLAGLEHRIGAELVQRQERTAAILDASASVAHGAPSQALGDGGVGGLGY